MVGVCSSRASFDGRHTMRLLRESSIRCTTSACALPVITLGRLDHDWYEVRAVEPAGCRPLRGVLVAPAAGRMGVHRIQHLSGRDMGRLEAEA